MKGITLSVILVVAVSSVALAADQPSGAVVINVPWGDWLSQFLLASASTFVTVATWVVGKVLPSFIRRYVTNEAITNSVNYAIASVAHAQQGKASDVIVTNSLVASAVKYIVDNEPRIAKQLGNRLQSLVVAQLSAAGVVGSDVSAATLVVPPNPLAVKKPLIPLLKKAA